MNEKKLDGQYVYCVVGGETPADFGGVGIDGNPLNTLSSNGITAVLHYCPSHPYDSKDIPTIRGWLEAHTKVIDFAIEKFDAVLPLRFNTIFKPQNGATSKETLEQWLVEKNQELKQKLEKVRGKGEYGVQIYAGPKLVQKKITGMKELEQKIEKSGPGTAYLYQQKLDLTLAKNVEELVGSYFKEFYSTVKQCVTDVSVLRTKNEEDKVMMANLACLATESQAKRLGGELEKIYRNGFGVRFTGPWPPYNFV